MSKINLLIAAVALTASVSSSLTFAEPVVVSSQLSPAQETGPISLKTPKLAGGEGLFEYNRKTHILSFQIHYSYLSGAPTMAHFHVGHAGVGGPIVQTICGSPAPTLLGACPKTASGILQGQWVVPKRDLPLMFSGALFINIHTQLNPKGEIRGQL